MAANPIVSEVSRDVSIARNLGKMNNPIPINSSSVRMMVVFALTTEAIPMSTGTPAERSR